MASAAERTPVGREARHSRVVADILRTQIATLGTKKPQTCDVRLVEHDDVHLHVLANPREHASEVTLSLAAPSGTPGLPDGAQKHVLAELAALGDAVRVADAPERGFHLTLHVDLARLPAEPAAQADAVRALASLRAAALGAPVRDALRALAEGGSTAAPATPVLYRANEAYFVCPTNDGVTFVFPLRCKDASDATIACTFFGDFGKAKAVRGAPPCRWDREPPLELKGCRPELAHGANGGYVSFTLERRHVEGGRLENAVWSTISFPAYASRHIKCSKAFFHSRMRKRTDSLLQTLRQAKPERKVEKKTASGRTFRREV